MTARTTLINTPPGAHPRNVSFSNTQPQITSAVAAAGGAPDNKHAPITFAAAATILDAQPIASTATAKAANGGSTDVKNDITDAQDKKLGPAVTFEAQVASASAAKARGLIIQLSDKMHPALANLPANCEYAVVFGSNLLSSHTTVLEAIEAWQKVNSHSVLASLIHVMR